MASVSVYSYWETTIEGERHYNGSLTTPVTVTAGDEEVVRKTFSVADAGTQKLFDVADDIGDFDFLEVEADQAVLLQVVVDDNATNGEAFMVFTLIANLPFRLPSKVALAGDGTVDQFDGTSDTIERLNVKNSSGSTAKVTVAAFT